MMKMSDKKKWIQINCPKVYMEFEITKDELIELVRDLTDELDRFD